MPHLFGTPSRWNDPLRILWLHPGTSRGCRLPVFFLPVFFLPAFFGRAAASFGRPGSKTLGELGELERARDLAQTAFASLEAQLGPENPRTTKAAWTLLGIARRAGDPEAIHRWSETLGWLIEADEADIDSAKLREIRQQLLDLQSASPPGAVAIASG